MAESPVGFYSIKASTKSTRPEIHDSVASERPSWNKEREKQLVSYLNIIFEYIKTKLTLLTSLRSEPCVKRNVIVALVVAVISGVSPSYQTYN